jgi:hypothetical protein
VIGARSSARADPPGSHAETLSGPYRRHAF